MPTGDCETHIILFLDFDFRVYPYIFQCPCHILLIGSSKGAVIFTQVTGKTPFLINVDPFQVLTSFQCSHPARRRPKHIGWDTQQPFL